MNASEAVEGSAILEPRPLANLLLQQFKQIHIRFLSLIPKKSIGIAWNFASSCGIQCDTTFSLLGLDAMSPSSSTKYLQPTSTSYHMDSDNEAHSDCSPRGSISLATSDDNLLTPRAPVSTIAQSVKAVSHTRRPAPRTVRFAEKPQLTPAPVYPPLDKSQKAKQVAKTALKGAGTVAGGIFGCICYIFAKACILDGGSGLSGSGSRVIVAEVGEDGFVQGNRRVVEQDMRGYIGYEKPRAPVPAGVRIAQQEYAGQKTYRSRNTTAVRVSNRAR